MCSSLIQAKRGVKFSPPRGLGLGGTTLINQMYYEHLPESDFDRWARVVKDSDWTADRIARFYEKVDNGGWFEEDSFSYIGHFEFWEDNINTLTNKPNGWIGG